MPEWSGGWSLWTRARLFRWRREACRSRALMVIGAGIAGLSLAYELCRMGQSVVVLDRGALGGGMTARTSAHLASQLDDFYHDLIRMRGLEEASLYYESQAAALDRIEQIQASEAIQCDFQRLDGLLFAASHD